MSTADHPDRRDVRLEKGYCGFQRTAGTGLPEDHPERGRA